MTALQLASPPTELPVPRVARIGSQVELLAEIYREDVNLCLWQRPADARAEQYVRALFQPPYLGMTWQCQGSPASIGDDLPTLLPPSEFREVLIADVVLLADMFATLLDVDRVGLRMSPLTQAMCPRFHVDRVPCRMVTTYGGPGTEWIANTEVNRDKLGHRSQGLPDEISGLIRSTEVIQQMDPQHVGLMKGESWQANQGGGLVHRSPALARGQARLVVTFDVVD